MQDPYYYCDDGGGPITRRRLLGGAATGLAVVSGAALLDACGGSATSARTTTAGSPPRRGGTLRVAVAGDSSLDTVDPHHAAAIPDYGRIAALYNTLGWSENPQFKPEYQLAEEITWNRTGTEWTIRLKSGVEFHNGKTLTADDLLYTVQRITNPKEAANPAPIFNWAKLSEFKKLDTRTVRITLSQPYSGVEKAFYDINSAIVPVGFNPKAPVGTGPFKFKSFTPGGLFVAEAFENFWGGRPYIDELRMIGITDETARVNALLAGQVDAANAIAPTAVPQLMSNSAVRVLDYPAGGFFPFVMNCTQRPFTDRRVRQAFRLMADRKQIIADAYLGHARLGNDLYSPDDAWYLTAPQREQNIEQAKALLRAAGYSGETLVLNVTDQGIGSIPAAQVYAQQCNAAGVTVKVREIDAATWVSNVGKWTFTNGVWNQFPYQEMVKDADGPGAPYDETNFGNQDPEFAGLFRQLFQEMDPAKQRQIAHDMQSIQFDRGGYIIVSFPNVPSAVSAKTQGWVHDPSGVDFGMFNFRKVSFNG
ncbi:MAG: ABC transporter substrate-binding protein [Solirubrobacteraceae bacterium]